MDPRIRIHPKMSWIRNTAVLWIRIGFNADPDPAYYLTADPGPESQTNADPYLSDL